MDEEAKEALQADIAQYKEDNKKIVPRKLWESRKVCTKHQPEKFKQCICQCKKRAKFFAWLEKERNKKRDEFAAKMTPKEVTAKILGCDYSRGCGFSSLSDSSECGRRRS
mmetsp:Transcript_29419/g.43428  ORF Transcript_29419/g.43428 Transcript_29419/m.43428 type:complete len:110 (-) Transcript_29419:3154-3483(-)